MGFTALLLSVSKGRQTEQVKRRAQQEMPGESRKRFPAAFPSAAQENEAGCGGSESASLHIFVSWH